MYPKERADLIMIHGENNVLTDDAVDELVVVRNFLKSSKYAYLYIRNDHIRRFKILDQV